MSGVIGPVLADFKESGEEFARAVMQELRVDSVQEMEKVPYEALAAAYLKRKPAFARQGKTSAGMPFRNSHYLGSPTDVGFRKETAQIPLLVGSVFGEFSSFSASAWDRNAFTDGQAEDIVRGQIGDSAAGELLPLFQKAYPERSPLDLLNLDTIFRLPEITYVQQRSALNHCTWSYLFNQDFPLDGGRTPWHCSDIPFVFHNTEFTPYAQIEGVTEKLQAQMFDALMAFARTGNPNNGSIPLWPCDTPQKEQVMVFDQNTGVRVNFDHDLVKQSAPVLQKWMMEKMAESQIQH